jgi:hypothetical protein
MDRVQALRVHFAKRVESSDDESAVMVIEEAKVTPTAILLARQAGKPVSKLLNHPFNLKILRAQAKEKRRRTCAVRFKPASWRKPKRNTRIAARNL